MPCSNADSHGCHMAPCSNAPWAFLSPTVESSLRTFPSQNAIVLSLSLHKPSPSKEKQANLPSQSPPLTGRSIAIAAVMADQSGLKLYVDLLSQPARAVAIFCRVNNIEAEEISVAVAKGECRTQEFQSINPACKVPAIDDDGFKLHESHAILRYLATTRHVADHWYPQDPKQRALIDSVLDWHHLNLRRNAFLIVVHRVISLLPGISKGIYPEQNDSAAEEAKIGLNQALEYIETVLLKGPHHFLENAQEVSIADLSLVCEIKQLLWLESGDQEGLLGSRPRIKAWVQAVENATNPEFNKVHSQLYAMAEKIQDGRKVSGQASL